MANINEVKVLLGGMDKENSPETMNMYDYLDAHNIRTVGNDQTDANYLSNLEGTLKVTTNLPSGQNKSIGSKGFETSSKAYIVRYNSQGRHQIVEFDYNLSLETVIFENMTDTNDIDILGWTTETFFSDIRLMHDKFLILNNGDDYPLFINIEDFKAKRGSRVVTKYDLILPKQPPKKPIQAIYLSDPTKSTNSLRGNLFQFRYNFEYEDSRSTSWSSVSKREVPTSEPSEGNGQNVSSNNVLLLKIDLSQPNIEKANLAVRIGLGNWLLANIIDLNKIKSLTVTNIPYDEETGELLDPNIKEAYDPITKEYQLLFYNEGLYPVLDQIEVENPYDAIPLKAETVEVVNGNILALGGITEGYDRPELEVESSESMGVEVSYYNPQLQNFIETKPNFDILRVDYTWHYKNIFTSHTVERWYIHFNDVPPKAGDRIVLKIKNSGSPTSITLDYVVTASDASLGKNATLQNAVNSMVSKLPNGNTSLTYGNGAIRYKADEGGRNHRLISYYVEYANNISYSTQSINTLKNGATYQVAVAYEDEFGKYFPIVTDERFVARFESLASTEGLLPEINWMLPKKAPEGAVRYNILLSENQTYQNYVTLTGVKEDGLSDSEYLVINLKSLSRFNKLEKDSQIKYDFTKGDKVTFIKTIDADGNTVRWFRYPFIELDIVDFKIETTVDPSDPNISEDKYWLTVRNTPLIEGYNLENKELVLELYTPKTKAITQESTMFFEIGESYEIINGEHSVTSGIIKKGDSFYRGRPYRSSLETNKTLLIEVADPNFSDNYESKYWSAGRARLYDDEVGRVERKASIRYSDEYTIGSKYNGVNRFYLERIYGEKGGETTSKYGAIKKLEMRDNALVCIQEMKVGVIPVYRTIIQDNADNQIITDSGKIFGSVQYRVGNYGCGTAKESVAVSRDGVIYFFDNNNCLPLRDSLSGLDVIDVNMTTYFTNYMKQAQSRGSKFIGYFDNPNKEYNITIQDKSGVLNTLSFSDDSTIYKDQPSSDFIVGEPSNGSVLVSGTNVTYFPDNDFIGNDLMPIIVGSTVKYVPIEVVAGDSTPDMFYFTPKQNQPLSTLVESNTISIEGINMPSPISIVDGTYSKNDGGWTSAPDTVVNGDLIKVRVMSSSSYETVTSTTLTVGGVSSTFQVKTIPDTVIPDEYFSVNFEVIEPPQTGSTNRYGVKVELSSPLTVDYECRVQIQYKSAFGGIQESIPVTIVIEAGDLSFETDYFVTDASPAGDFVIGLVAYSSLYNGDIVTTADSVTRVVTSPVPNQAFHLA